MLEDALLLNAAGKPIRHTGRTRSSDWDEVQAFCESVYMPYRVQPLDRYSRPDATMISANAGRVTMTRFSYGTGIYLDRFDQQAGNILVLNTLRGALNHQSQAAPVQTGAGDSFVVDCSRTDYWLEGDPDHMQFNLTIPHQVMAETAERWFGFVPNDRLWTSRIKFGGTGSSWLRLLQYASTAVYGPGPSSADGALGRHLEETICLELLRHWAIGAGVQLEPGAGQAAPRYVRQAEEILEAEARNAPLIGDVAQRLGVTARTLSGAFQRYRGVSPRAFLAARRLDGLRKDLLSQSGGRTVTQIAADWGYTNLGAMAGQYQKRFGELPSATRARAAGR